MIAQRSLQTSHPRRKRHLDRGAVAVEMALIMPLLISMIVGIIDFSRIFNAQIQLSQAAREGARVAALGAPGGFTATDAITRTNAALNNPAFQGNAATVSVRVVNSLGGVVVASNSVCPGQTNFSEVTVSIAYVKIWWGPSSLTQKARMQCAG